MMLRHFARWRNREDPVIHSYNSTGDYRSGRPIPSAVRKVVQILLVVGTLRLCGQLLPRFESRCRLATDAFEVQHVLCLGRLEVDVMLGLVQACRTRSPEIGDFFLIIPFFLAKLQNAVLFWMRGKDDGTVSFRKLAHCSASLRPSGSVNWQSAHSNQIQDSFSRLNRYPGGIVASRASEFRFPPRTAARVSARESFGCRRGLSTPNRVLRHLVQIPQRLRKSRNLSKGWRAQVRLDPSGGGDGDEEDGVVRTVVNLALAGGLTYLTVTGRLGWVFDAIISLWLVAVIVPVVGLVAFLWFAEREIIRGACPNCGNEFQVFEFTVKEGEQRCPYCSQPFKVENKQFVREGPSFSERQQYGGFNPFGFGQSNPEARRKDVSADSSGIIVDVEAEVRDRD